MADTDGTSAFQGGDAASGYGYASGYASATATATGPAPGTPVPTAPPGGSFSQAQVDAAREQNRDAAAYRSLLADDGKGGGDGPNGDGAGNDAGADGADGAGREAADIDIDITIPDGVTVDPDALSALKGIARDHGLDRDGAEKCVQIPGDAIERFEAHRRAESNRIIESWEGEIKSHPEFGGAKLAESVEAFKLMMQKYGSPRLQEDFKQMGVYSHPEFAFMIMRMSRDLSEHRSVGGASQARPERVSTAKALFPDFN
ncbi:MAG: hypothetical protein LIQ30_06945 [Planctomycetes bacterium]|nr:hypothetical protein [Planctomycetota bacterium]